MIVLLYHAAFAADYYFSQKISLRNFSRKKAAFLPPAKPLSACAAQFRQIKPPKKVYNFQR